MAINKCMDCQHLKEGSYRGYNNREKITNMTNEQKIKEACIKANPEIMELKFGCEVMIGGFIEMVYEAIGNHPVVEKIRTDTYSSIGVSSIEKVLGREIHLADILSAIEEATKTADHSVHVNSMGHMEDVWDNEDMVRSRGFWNLRKDSLSDQSEQTKQFLAELLDKE